MHDSEDMRDTLLCRLEQDLIGPYDEGEILQSRPSDVYLTGILWPREARMGAEEDERLGLSGAELGELDSSGEEEMSLAGAARPCSAGVSFAVCSDGTPTVNISVRFATYVPVDAAGPEAAGQQNGREAAHQRKEWKRQAHSISVSGIGLGGPLRFIDLEPAPFNAPSGVRLYIRSAKWSKGTLATVTILNWAEPDDVDGRDAVEQQTLFQVRIEVRPAQGTLLVARPSTRLALDEDSRSAELLYRNAREFATGHVCSAEWRVGADLETADMISTSWIPVTEVPPTSAIGHDVFSDLRNDQTCRPLLARWLATAEPGRLGRALQLLPAAYGNWIDGRESELPSLPDNCRDQARKNVGHCRNTYGRMVAGATLIAEDAVALRAFCLANLAMDIQHGWDPERIDQGHLEWRPFQLGFILLAAASVVDRKHPDREIMDLLWFPTGGGKTEAYLALIAFLAFYRRLAAAGVPDTGSGVAAIMRYTLRLLTTQQFARAAAVLLACEAIRRGHVPEARISHQELGETPFSVGLWVGGAATPNRVQDAASALGGATDQPTPKQLVHCPACRGLLNWKHDEETSAIHVQCDNTDCILFHPTDPLPIWTVDEDVYRMRPTLLIGTIDKFAQIVRRKEIRGLFGLDKHSQLPDLILQDELHLISGPLGTIAGLYEAAIDRMLSSTGGRPKIIGSTATIRRAAEQVMALFDRKTAQFPPPCLDASDSAFSVVDRDSPSGRLYAGITTAGRSTKFTLQAVAVSLLQSALGGTSDADLRNPYWTLVSYFNSLRELGGALVLMQDDVNDGLALVARRRGEQVRRPRLVEELTSRRTQAEVRDMLDQLAIPAGSPSALDVVLATNMLSVGVDIPRLGLMLVAGQPKSMAEYIQATSRVGRGNVRGLVVAVLNNAKARDRSHYESFSTWHGTLYRDVEPTSVTPFASRARDRALHAVLTAQVRHLVPGLLDRPTLNDEAVKVAMELIQDIVQRSTRIDPQESAVRQELEGLLDNWRIRGPRNYWDSQRVRDSLLQDAERAAALRAMGRMPGGAWPTLNSMRDVEPSTCFRLVERLGR